jgi:hypothetical protein
MLIEDVYFNDFTGTSKKYDPVVGTLVCSTETVRSPITPRHLAKANSGSIGMPEHRSHEHQCHESKWEGSSMAMPECG